MRKIAVPLALLLVAAFSSPAAAAANTTTYHGTWSTAAHACRSNGAVDPRPFDASLTGVWNLMIVDANSDSPTAKVTYVGLYDGRLEAAYQIRDGVVTRDGDALSIDFGWATATLAGDNFRMQLNLDSFGATCDPTPGGDGYNAIIWTGMAGR